MRRRDFIALLGGAAACPATVHAQQSTTRLIAILDPGIPHLFDAFRQGMRDLGYVDGRSVRYEVRSSRGRAEYIPVFASELVQLKADVIVTAGTLGVRAAKEATPSIPIVFAALGDAVSSGAVDNLARPSGNVTGLSFLNNELSSKRLEILRDLMPSLSHIAVLHDPNTDPSFLRSTKEAAEHIILKIEVLAASGVEEFRNAFENARKARVEALNILASAFFNANRAHLVKLAEEYRLPTIYETGEYVGAGGLISYGPNLLDMFRRAAGYVHKILQGARPAQLPVEQPTKFEMLINLKTAKALGLTVPPLLLARADEVID